MRCPAALTLALAACIAVTAGSRVPGADSDTVAAAEPGAVNHRPLHGEITSLPGFEGQLPSRHAGGYISVGTRQLYYYLIESERSPAHDPVVLWLNGGPGCSSFDGWVYEQGPFKLHLDKHRRVSLTRNPHAWSRVATMIFLDSPSPVGLSYSTNPGGDYSTNDTATAADSHAFLRALFTRYPHLAARDFYVAGESYAGIYVPMLVAAVVDGNSRGAQPHINIKGYLVGNGCTDDEYDGNAQVPFAFGKSLISSHLYSRTNAACNGRFWDAEPGSRCEALLSRVWAELSGLNLYNVLEACHVAPDSGPLGADATARVAERRERVTAVLRANHGAWPVTGVVRRGSVVRNFAHLLGHDPPCTLATEADMWLNDPAVRAAIHAAPQSVTGPWQLCSDRITYHADGGSMLPVHASLVRDAGLRAIIYSGDHDLCVPHTGSEAWTSAMHRSSSPECKAVLDGAGSSAAPNTPDEEATINKCSGVAKPWQPWFVFDAGAKQVAGYVVEYASGLSYATVKGAGHMVPETNPREALAMFSRFTSGRSLTQDDRVAPAAL